MNVGIHTYEEGMGEHNKTSDVCKTLVIQRSTWFTLPSHGTSLPKNEKMWSPSPASRLEFFSTIYLLKNTNSSGGDGMALQCLKDGLEIDLTCL